jgi:DNA-binding beta-propeller fold protein YncE
MRQLLILAIAAAALPIANNVSAQSAPTYRVATTYQIGGDGGWDYVVPDPASRRVYIGRSNRVLVVDERDGKLLGEVTGINGAHGTAIAQKTGHGFATSGNDSSVVMFDLKTFKTLGRIPAAEDADAVIFDPVSNRVFTFNGDAHNSTVIDPRKGKLVTNIPLGGKPEYAVSAGDGKVYANLTDISEVVEIDARKLIVTKRWSTAPCKNPVSMAIDVKNHRLFSGCRSGVMAVSDYRAGKVVATLPIGTGVDGAGFDPLTRDAFASNADGTLTVIHQDTRDTYHVVENVQTSAGSRNMGLDPVNHRIYLAAAKFGPRPDSSASNPRRRPPMIPGSFGVIVVEPVK